MSDSGPIPLGYCSAEKKIKVVSEEADLVQKIFEGYLRLGSIRELAVSLNQEGIKPKPRHLTGGCILATACFRVGPLPQHKGAIGSHIQFAEVSFTCQLHSDTGIECFLKRLYAQAHGRCPGDEKGVKSGFVCQEFKPDVAPERPPDNMD